MARGVVVEGMGAGIEAKRTWRLRDCIAAAAAAAAALEERLVALFGFQVRETIGSARVGKRMPCGMSCVGM